MSVLSLRASLFTLALASTAVAQYPDMAAIFVRAEGISAATNYVESTCADTFSCTPLQLLCRAGDDVDVSMLAKLNDLFILQLTVDTQNLQCLTLPLVGFTNALILPLSSSTFTVAAGFMTIPDRGRCNGGYVFMDNLFRVPASIPPGVSVAFQGFAATVLSGGGNGYAFTRAVVMTTY